MGFSEKMRESLGAEGARVRVQAPEGTVSRGETTSVSIEIEGGTRAATIDALIVRIVEADRHWIRDEDGAQIAEGEAQTFASRKGLTAGWNRYSVLEQRVEVGHTVEPREQYALTVEIPVPTECKPTAPFCSHTLNVQADIKGQIDPAGNVRITVQ